MAFYQSFYAVRAFSIAIILFAVFITVP